MSITYANINFEGVKVNVTFEQIIHTTPKCVPKYTKQHNLVETKVDIRPILLPGDATSSFPYHIHELPVENQNCTTTAGHYDPFGIKKLHGNSYNCMKNHVTCEIGDLSGKHGKLTSAGATYFDYLPNHIDITKYSFVIHDSEDSTKRIGCATIVDKLE